ncbi:PREDICTED: putative 1-phosphatidylinositol-3-phosphate 5-kinase FAB1D [Nelumbo nucifera]|nr:PREDICTED: putative 1-phosphatidylinositol-3-phosphate 5-kinase FAB1D [Nelumbo nucifera]
MQEVMNGKFKVLVSQLLMLKGIFLSEETGESWVDIVTSLSWEAALIVKPDAFEGKTMDLEGYFKVKCIATGSRNQSQVIKGLVFKKNSAHKHMHTKYKNPRLLLLQGMLGQCSSRLSSFDSMDQEKDNMKTIIEMIETCHPNVVLVEKTVSHDVQESLLTKGITLVFDMKLHRLEQIARCTGSKIVSSADSLVNQEMKQCDSFHFEKFIEEHGGYVEGGKRPSKTLMFLEGCPRPLGCTILLKGAPSDELKKIKCVVQYAVLVAYHTILETSFLVDQRAMFSSVRCSRIANGFLSDQKIPFVGSSGAFLHPNGSWVDSPALSCTTTEIPISDGFREKSVNEGMSPNSVLGLDGNSTLLRSYPNVHSLGNDISESAFISHNMPDNESCHLSEALYDPIIPTVHSGQLLSSLSASVKILVDSFPLVSSTTYHSISTCLGFKERELENKKSAVFPVTTSPEALDICQTEIENVVEEMRSHIGKQAEPLSACPEIPLDTVKVDIDNEDQMEHNNGISSALDTQAILFLMCSRNILRGTICEQNRLSRINYYRNSDVPLGWFLCENLLNQRHRCSKCSEPPESHIYHYAHHNGRLTIRVKQLPKELHLPGEAEGKLWMWTSCLKCKPENGILKSTRRVVISTVSLGLSFGKFLELSFSNHYTSCRLSNCTHSLFGDSLFFYGLGPTVAMFRYSPVDIYTVSMPPQILEFNNPIGQEWFKKEAEDVLTEGLLLFMEVNNSLWKIGSGFSSSLSNVPLGLGGPVRKLSEVEEMLRQEKSDFEALIQKALDKNGHLEQSVHKLLNLNGLRWELCLELYVWDRRLHSLMFSDSRIINNGCSNKEVYDEQLVLQKSGISAGRTKERKNTLPSCEGISDDASIICNDPHDVETTLSSINYHNSGNSGFILETEPKVKLEETSIADEINITEVKASEPMHEDFLSGSGQSNTLVNSSFHADTNEGQTVGHLSPVQFSSNECASTASRMLDNFVLGQGCYKGPSCSSILPLDGDNCQGNYVPISEHLQGYGTNTVTTDSLRHTDSIISVDLDGSTLDEMDMNSGSKDLDPGAYTNSIFSNSADSEDWVWNSFAEIRKAYRKELRRGCSQKFRFINNYTPEFLTSLTQLIMNDGSRLHVPVGPDDNVVSVFEGEFSSIIACALALLHDQHRSTKTWEGRAETGKTIESLQNLSSDVSLTSPYWSSTSYLDSNRLHLTESVSMEELQASSSDGLNPLDPLMFSRSLHVEISLGVGKFAKKGKYSVVCLYYKEFHALRRQCCPCELDYIASLSHCQNWDAKGGKSKSFFAKTLDDRFIIKEIKKTEFDSFLKFAPDYFKHINQSFNSGSQTCLAKILGLYQVIIRQSKSGKEFKHELMVMENLTFGRNIARLYDLKGALHSRYISAADASNNVLLDQNFIDDMHVSPLFVSSKTKHLLQRAVWNDTSFLTSINVMDYSLLVGVDTQRHELVCGIIDYLRQYTWDKHLETWVKASLVLPKNVSPTVISPKEYKKRFRKFMSMHFLSVPECWNPQIPLGFCKFCYNKSDDSSQLKDT